MWAPWIGLSSACWAMSGSQIDCWLALGSALRPRRVLPVLQLGDPSFLGRTSTCLTLALQPVSNPAHSPTRRQPLITSILAPPRSCAPRPLPGPPFDSILLGAPLHPCPCLHLPPSTDPPASLRPGWPAAHRHAPSPSSQGAPAPAGSMSTASESSDAGQAPRQAPRTRYGRCAGPGKAQGAMQAARLAAVARQGPGATQAARPRAAGRSCWLSGSTATARGCLRGWSRTI